MSRQVGAAAVRLFLLSASFVGTSALAAPSIRDVANAENSEIVGLESALTGHASDDILKRYGLPNVAHQSGQNDPVIEIMTDLDPSDLAAGISTSSLLATIGAQAPRINVKKMDYNFSVESFCKSIEQQRSASSPSISPIVVTTFLPLDFSRLAQSYLSSACVKGGVLQGVKPLILQVPIGFVGVVFEGNDFPQWLTANHLIAASLAARPSSPPMGFRVVGVSNECAPLPATKQPAPSDRVETLKSAECWLFDESGRRVIGERTKLYSRSEGSAAAKSDNNLASLAYDLRYASDLKVWADIDDALPNWPILIKTHGIDDRAPFVICQKFLPPVEDRQRFEVTRDRLCRLRTDARAISDREIGELPVGAHAAIIDDLGAFEADVKFKRGAHLQPLAMSGMVGGKLSDYLLSGAYPFGQAVWLTINPSDLANQQVRALVDALTRGGAGDAYKGHIAFLADVQTTSH